MTQYPWSNTTNNIAAENDSRYETPGGAQAKADAALEDAKEYTDAKLALPELPIANEAIVERHYRTESVSTRTIAQKAVTRSKIGTGAVGSQELDPTLLQNYGDIAVQAKFQEVDEQLADIALNVKNYGAIGDGVTDDTAAIQAAIDTAAANGYGSVYIPEGTFIFTAFTLKSGVTIRGNGVRSTVLRSLLITGPFVTIEGITGAPLSYMGFEQLIIITPNIGPGETLLQMSKAYYFQCTDVRFFGGSLRQGKGVHAIGSNVGYYGTFTRVGFSSFDIGVMLQDSANAHRFFACDFYNCNIDAEIIDSNGINFFGCTFQDFHKKAVYFNDSGAGKTNRNSLFGCYIEAIGSGTEVECGIEINSTTRTTMLYGNLYNNLRSAHPEVIDGSKTTTRLEWGSTSYSETLKLPTFTNFPSFDDATKPLAISETRGSIAHLTTTGQVDKLGAIMNNAAGTPLWSQVMVAVSNVLNLSGLTLQNGKIQQFNDGNILLGTLADTTERQLNYDTGFKMVRYHDGAGWHYLQGNRSGTTANRPTIRFVGMEYFDATLNKPVWWNGTVWVDATGTTA